METDRQGWRPLHPVILKYRQLLDECGRHSHLGRLLASLAPEVTAHADAAARADRAGDARLVTLLQLAELFDHRRTPGHIARILREADVRPEHQREGNRAALFFLSLAVPVIEAATGIIVNGHKLQRVA